MSHLLLLSVLLDLSIVRPTILTPLRIQSLSRVCSTNKAIRDYGSQYWSIHHGNNSTGKLLSPNIVRLSFFECLHRRKPRVWSSNQRIVSVQAIYAGEGGDECGHEVITSSISSNSPTVLGYPQLLSTPLTFGLFSPSIRHSRFTSALVQSMASSIPALRDPLRSLELSLQWLMVSMDRYIFSIQGTTYKVELSARKF